MFKEFKYIFKVFVLIVCLCGGSSCVFAKDIIFRGKVIDTDTKEPIVGAVVVLYWYEARETIAGESTRLKDVKETLTDQNGEWSIAGPKGRAGMPIPYISFLTGIHYTREPQLIIFKPAYCSWSEGFCVNACKGRIKSSGEGEVLAGKTIELPKLTGREDRVRNIPGIVAGEGSMEKQTEFIRLINEEKRNLGLPEVYK